MNILNISNIFCIILLANNGTADDEYCGLENCEGLQHIGCHNDGKFSSNCPANARLIKMQPYRAMILKMFNEMRNKVAGGEIQHLPKASRMATMRWCKELELLAKLNLKKCDGKPDPCSNTEDFSLVGQSIETFKYKGKVGSYTDEQLIKTRLAKWLEQNKYATEEQLKEYPESQPENMIGHFTVVVNDHSTNVGCGAMRFDKDSEHFFIITCNFSQTNIVGEPTYAFAETPASGCKSKLGTNEEYPNLCNPFEVYDNAKLDVRKRRGTTQ